MKIQKKDLWYVIVVGVLTVALLIPTVLYYIKK